MNKDINTIASFAEEKQLLLLLNNTSSTTEWNIIKNDYLTRLKSFILLNNISKYDEQNVSFGVKYGTGGDEAKIFAEEMFQSYLNVCLIKKWQVTDVMQPISGHIQCKIKGKQVYKFMKNEAGIHRVQRIPVTEKKGRIQTSTISVFCVPDIYNEEEIVIQDKDIRVDCFRAGGKGGQNVNKVSSAVRIVHLPTKLSVESQKERNQIANREDAMNRLKEKLREYYNNITQENRQNIISNQTGSGGRNEKMRTYDFSANKIIDHRFNFSCSNLSIVLSRGAKFVDFIEEILFLSESTLFDLSI